MNIQIGEDIGNKKSDDYLGNHCDPTFLVSLLRNRISLIEKQNKRERLLPKSKKEHTIYRPKYLSLYFSSEMPEAQYIDTGTYSQKE